jgi:formate/nitrite transporter FocA (FNT family)
MGATTVDGAEGRLSNVDDRPANRAQVSEREIEDIEELSSPRTPVIFEIVRRLGEEEMERPITSLWWSGLAAGLSMSFSLLAQAILEHHIPASDWKPLVTSLGYSVGFVMVVLSRQQLFTETAITVVLPSVIVMTTYLISAEGVMRIVAGSMEAYMLTLNGTIGVSTLLTGFMLPVLLGNILGGTALFALIAYAQVMKEI